MKQKMFFALVFFVFTLVSFHSFAANKVVVIPLGGGLPFEPYAPLADSSPSEDNYTVTTHSVTEIKTGLIWEKNPTTLTMSQESAWDHCQSRTTGGWHTWRLPSIDELHSLVYIGAHSPAINSFVFPGNDSVGYWSATTLASDVGRALIVSFNHGNIYHNDKTTFYRVRCVRGQAALHNRLKDNGDGTVFDLSTGLVWQKRDDATKRFFIDADAYCRGLSLGGKRDWRMPFIKELQSIAEYRTSEPAIDLLFFPATQSARYWAADVTSYQPLYSWSVDFGYGSAYGTESTNASYAINYVRCVR